MTEIARTPDMIAVEIRVIEESVSRTVLQGAVEIGNRLHEVKSVLQHGEWETWCQQNLNYSKSKAERFMKISTEYGDENSPYFQAISKTSTCTDLSISNALRLLQVPEEEVENFVENNDLSTMTARELEEEIKQLKKDLKEANETLECQSEVQKEESETYAKLMEEQEQELKRLKTEAEFAAKEKEDLQKEVDELRTELKDSTTVTVDDERVADLQKKLEEKEAELKAKEEDLKAQKKKEKETREKLEEQIKLERENAENAREEEKEELKAQAAEEAKKEVAEQLQKAEEEKAEMQEQLDRMGKQLETASDDTLMRIRFLTGQLQETLADLKGLLMETNEETQTKLRKAFRQIFDNYSEITE